MKHYKKLDQYIPSEIRPLPKFICWWYRYYISQDTLNGVRLKGNRWAYYQSMIYFSLAKDSLFMLKRTLKIRANDTSVTVKLPRGVTLYIDQTGMRRWSGYGFSRFYYISRSYFGHFYYISGSWNHKITIFPGILVFYYITQLSFWCLHYIYGPKISLNYISGCRFFRFSQHETLWDRIVRNLLYLWVYFGRSLYFRVPFCIF